MKRRFTGIAPAMVLKGLGWYNPATWAEVFDYLSDRGMLISISRSYDCAEECFSDGYDWQVDFEDTLRMGEFGYGETWEKAAEEVVMICMEHLK